MRKLPAMEKGALVLSMLFVVAGIVPFVHPTEGYVHHPSNNKGLVTPMVSGEYVTKNKSRVYGGI